MDFNPADINGDGLTDLVWTETKGSKHRLQYALANKNGALVMTAFTSGDMRLEYDDYYVNSNFGDGLRVYAEVVDYNGDGRHDLLVYSEESGGTRLHLAVPQATGGWQLSDGTGTDDLLFTDRYRYADLNSDGLLDAYRLVARPPTETSPFAPAGYNLEMRYLTQDTTQAATSSRYYKFGPAMTKPLDFAPQAPGTTDTLNWQSLETAKVQLADVDGDGRADLVTWGNDTTWMYVEVGTATIDVLRRLEVFRQTDTGFVRYGAALDVMPPVAGVITPKGLRVADLNQDGLSDLVYFVGNWYRKSSNNYQWTGDWHYRLGTGTGFTDAVLLLDTMDGAQAPSSPSLHDENGDGYADFIWHDVPNSQLNARHWSPEHGAFETGTPKRLRATDGEDKEQYFTLDADGDGNGDLVHVSESSSSTEVLKIYPETTTGRANLITGITNGLGPGPTSAMNR